jgi:hypothetical protein
MLFSAKGYCSGKSKEDGDLASHKTPHTIQHQESEQTLDSTDINPPLALQTESMKQWALCSIYGWYILKRFAQTGAFLSEACGVVCFTTRNSVDLPDNTKKALDMVTGLCIPSRIAFRQIENFAEKNMKKNNAFLEAVIKSHKPERRRQPIQVIVDSGDVKIVGDDDAEETKAPARVQQDDSRESL